MTSTRMPGLPVLAHLRSDRLNFQSLLARPEPPFFKLGQYPASLPDGGITPIPDCREFANDPCLAILTTGPVTLSAKDELAPVVVRRFNARGG